MIGKIELYIRWLRRLFSRTEWAIRLFRLPVSEGTANEPGLVMIQIDGLSHPEFQRALKHGNLPFLSHRLIHREGYRSYRQYSGLPSSTPQVQGQIFYGAPCCVGAFKFVDSQTGKTFTMYQHEGAS